MDVSVTSSVDRDHKTSATDATGKMKIPIRNLWLLMFYASDLRRCYNPHKHDVEENPDDIADIIAEILCYSVDLRLMRNLSFGYLSKTAVLNRVRGRIDMLYTESRQLLKKAKVCCCFEELSVNTSRNRYVRAALERLSALAQVNRELRHRCRTLAMRLGRIGVIDDKPSNYSAKSERFGLHDSEDRIMLFAADLAFALMLPTQLDGDYALVSSKDEELEKLFEQAVRGFYCFHLKGACAVSSKKPKWQTSNETEGIKAILPGMQTDITITEKSSDEQLIIDTKFNEITTKGHRRDKTLRSDDIYQIYAYLRSQEKPDKPQSYKTSGMLLHPSVGTDYNESVVIQGHKFMFYTVDLKAKATEIKKRLLEILPPPFKP